MNFFATTGVIALLSIAVSTLGLALLTHSNEKRRRVYDLHDYSKLHLRKVFALLVCAPLPFLLFFGRWPALIMWLMAICLIGWWLAWRKPVKLTQSEVHSGDKV